MEALYGKNWRSFAIEQKKCTYRQQSAPFGKSLKVCYQSPSWGWAPFGKFSFHRIFSKNWPSMVNQREPYKKWQCYNLVLF